MEEYYIMIFEVFFVSFPIAGLHTKRIHEYTEARKHEYTKLTGHQDALLKFPVRMLTYHLERCM